MFEVERRCASSAISPWSDSILPADRSRPSTSSIRPAPLIDEIDDAVVELQVGAALRKCRWRRSRTRGVLRDEVVAERKIAYLRNVGQGSSGLEGEACSTLAMSSQRRSGTAPR